MEDWIEYLVLFGIPPLLPIITAFICLTSFRGKINKAKLDNPRYQHKNCSHCQLKHNMFQAGHKMKYQRQRAEANHYHQQYMAKFYPTHSLIPTNNHSNPSGHKQPSNHHPSNYQTGTGHNLLQNLNPFAQKHSQQHDPPPNNPQHMMTGALPAPSNHNTINAPPPHHSNSVIPSNHSNSVANSNSMLTDPATPSDPHQPERPGWMPWLKDQARWYGVPAAQAAVWGYQKYRGGG